MTRIEPGGFTRMFTEEENAEVNRLFDHLNALYARVGVEIELSVRGRIASLDETPTPPAE